MNIPNEEEIVMKMVLIICPEFRQPDVRALIEKHGVHAYSELKDITGEGATGRRMGTRVWPEKSVLVFTVVSDEMKDALLSDLSQCATQLYPDEGFRAFVLPVEKAL